MTVVSKELLGESPNQRTGRNEAIVLFRRTDLAPKDDDDDDDDVAVEPFLSDETPQRNIHAKSRFCRLEFLFFTVGKAARSVIVTLLPIPEGVTVTADH